MTKESKNIGVGIILAYVNQFSSIFISLLYVPIMLAMLGQEQYGLYAIAQSLVSYLNLTDVGIGTTAIRYNAQYLSNGDQEGQKKINGMFTLIYFAIILICLILGAGVCGVIDKIYASYSAESIVLIKRLFLIAVLNLVITLAFKVYKSIVLAYERFIFTRVMNLLQTFINPLCLLAVLRLGYGAAGLLFVAVAMNFVDGTLHLIYCLKKLKIRITFHGLEKKLFVTILLFTVFIFINTLATQLFTISDKFIVSVTMTSGAVAIIAIVQQLENYYYSFSNIVTAVYMPRLTKMVSGENRSHDEMLGLFIKVGRVQAILAAFLLGGIFAVGQPFIQRWLGDDYKLVYPLLLIVLLPQMFGAAQSMFTQLMQAMNLHKMRSILGLIVAAIKFIITFITVYLFGLFGCAVAYAVMYAVRMVVYNTYYTRKLDWNVTAYWKQEFRVFTVLILIAAAIAVPIRFIPIVGYLQVILCALLYAVVFLALCWLLVLNREEKGLVKQLVGKIIVHHKRLK